MKLRQQYRLWASEHPLLARALRSPWVAMVTVAIAVWALTQFFGVLRSAYGIRQELSAAEEKTDSLKKRNQELTRSLAKFNSPDFLEREAKDRMNLKNPGEEVVVIVPEAMATSTPAAEKNFWSRLRSLIPF